LILHHFGVALDHPAEALYNQYLGSLFQSEAFL